MLRNALASHSSLSTYLEMDIKGLIKLDAVEQGNMQSELKAFNAALRQFNGRSDSLVEDRLMDAHQRYKEVKQEQLMKLGLDMNAEHDAASLFSGLSDHPSPAALGLPLAPNAIAAHIVACAPLAFAPIACPLLVTDTMQAEIDAMIAEARAAGIDIVDESAGRSS